MMVLKQLYPTIPNAAIALKMLLPLLAPSVIQGLGVRRVVQNPGEAVFTAPVRYEGHEGSLIDDMSLLQLLASHISVH
jgi:hypothetical protein